MNLKKRKARINTGLLLTRWPWLSKIHDYLESLPETGKVLSLGTMIKIAEKLNNGKPLDNFELAVLYNELP